MPNARKAQTRPAPSQSRIYDATVLAAAVAVPVLGRFMSFDAGGTVWFSGLERLPLPTLCPSRWLGFRCITCGMTRSIVAIMHGDLHASLSQHAVGWFVFLLIVCQIPYRTARLLMPGRPWPLAERLGFAGVVVATALLLGAKIFEAIGR